VSREPRDVASADYVVVPGQGSFGPFARGVESGLADALRAHIAAGRPYLGICLGMQVLFESSEEAPGAKGLGIFSGTVKRLVPGIDPSTARPYALPHIGWNTVELPAERTPTPAAASSTEAPPSRHFYFAHSFAAEPTDPSLVSGVTQYGAARFASTVTRGAILGVQFHPEKSQHEGLAVLARFFSV
jgi:imidazole glycerol-phosphate synthase subunit HisH